VSAVFVANHSANLFADLPHIPKIQVAVKEAGRADTNQGDVGFTQREIVVARSPESSGFDAGADEVPQPAFHDGRSPCIDGIELGRRGVYTNHVVPIAAQARR
jgi:hypothetical protein